MAFEPINIFSHKIDPAGVINLLQKEFGEVKVTGPVVDWTNVEIRLGKKGFFSRPKVIAFGHSSEYYDGEGWPRQVLGMQNYFANFPDSPNKLSCLQLIRSFRFSLAVPVHDLDINGHDERLEVLYAVCKHLDGAIFTPTSLRDSRGRILLSADGHYDDTAVLPRLPSTEDHPDVADDASDNDDEDYEDPVRPTPERIAARTLALTAVAARATLELDNMESDDDMDVHRKRILEWIEELGIGSELEPQEWKVLQIVVGSLEQQDFINAMWRLAIGKVAISKADPDDVSRVSSLAMERHLAINWLYGHSKIYSQTDTPT